MKLLKTKKYGRLIIVEVIRVPKVHTKAICICECGNEVEARLSAIVSGNTVSCGCARTKHGESTNGTKTRLYNIYDNMVHRCHDARTPQFEFYGWKGVVVCDEWRNSAAAFFTWAHANGYTDELELDKDELSNKLGVKKNYSPETCQWVTHARNLKIVEEQRCNKI